LVTERPGKIRVIEKGKLLPEPLYTFPEISETGEEGLLSMTLDPDYPQNHFLYLVVAVPKDGGIVDQVMRFLDTGTELADPSILIDNIPAARFHAGSRVAFGPDGKLYVSTGDATDKNLAQDKKSLAGKILRINADGGIPNDNPFSGSPVWSYGHRNPQGLAWHPDNGFLYESEHGPSGFDGPGGGDEVNLIEKGKNYGWPLVSHEEKRSGTEAPLIVFTPAEAPASLLVYSGRQFSEWRGNLFFGALKGEGLMRLVLDEQNPKRVVYYEKLKAVDFGRIREVMEGPDGFIYFTTSNRDGRGTPTSEDDRIFRIRFE
jgi:glucose/arabinose dehydrogenase